jgi:hypothetical protein
MSLSAQSLRMVKTPSERVRDSQANLVAAGGRRVVAMLKPEAVEALDELVETEYAASATACISQAVIETAKRNRRRKK